MTGDCCFRIKKLVKWKYKSSNEYRLFGNVEPTKREGYKRAAGGMEGGNGDGGNGICRNKMRSAARVNSRP